MKVILVVSMLLMPALLLAQEVAVEAPNPFFEEWTTPFGVPPFEKIKNAHYLPAVERGIVEHQAEVDGIVSSKGVPTFANTIEALEGAGELLDKVSHVFFSLLSARTDDELNDLARELSPRLSKHFDNILLDAALFARVKSVYDQKEKLELTVEERALLEETWQDFVRGGANLDEKQKEELRAINQELAVLTLEFGQNILEEDNGFQLIIEKPEELDGLPSRVIDGGAKAAKERGLEGKWVFTLHKPSLFPFITYSTRRDLREKMYRGYIERGANGNKLDNRETIKKIVALRTRKARLFGFASYAEFALARRVAANPENVYKLLNKLWTPALARAKRELAEMQALADQEGGKFKLESWDWWFYAEKVRKARYDLDDKELRPYFEISRVQQGAFDVATKLYGIKFIERKDVPVYHKDVKAFEVQEADGSHLGIFYTDFFPRASKRGGAWCGTYRDSHRRDGKKVYPVVNNVGNFSMPTSDKPALLSFEEVTTLFHEFGHALHVLFNDTKYTRTADAVRVDFVELPSQIMENWASEPEVLKMYARHYETGEAIPDDLIAKLQKSSTFNQGFATVEYLAASLLDMHWHSTVHEGEIDVDKFEQETLDKIGLIPEIISRYRSSYFRHIFSGGYYAAGYYSYIWAAVLDADAFEAFKENGLFDKKTAAAFRTHVLSKGGTEDQMILYKRFRGSDPKIDPLLKRRGLLEEE